MSINTIFKTPFQHGHDHFIDSIEHFGLIDQNHHHDDGHHHDSQDEKILKSLRSDMVDFVKNPQKIKNEQCYKKCLLLEEKDFVTFCLNRQCNSSFNNAMSALNLLK